MFDIGFWELIVISVLGLVVLGPERLPVAIRTVSRGVSAVKGTADSLKEQLSNELKAQELQETLKNIERQRLKKERLPGKKSLFDNLDDTPAFTQSTAPKPDSPSEQEPK